MPRIRTIKPEFFDDEDLCALPPLHRLCYAGLWCQADKAGRLEDRPKRLKARVLPFDEVDMDLMLADLVQAGFIIRYVVDGKQYITIKPSSWQKHQRPRTDEPESLIPPVDTARVFVAHADSDESVTPQSLGKEGNGTEKGKELRDASLRARFDRFWDSYPRKVGKDAAWAEFKKRNPGDDLTDAMIAAVTLQRASAQWQKEGGQYIPNPRTWLHQGRWEDEPIAAARTSRDTGVDWFEECKQIHHGECGLDRMRHHTRKQLEAARRQQAN
jgi:hypothetical protein